MKNVSLGRTRTRAVIKASSLLVLGIVIIAFLATPLVSLARGAGSISQSNVKANVKTNRDDNNGNDNNGNGNNGNGNNGNNGNDNNGNNGNNGNDNNGNIGDQLQNLLPNLPNLPDGGRLQKLLGRNNGNGNNGNGNNGNGNNGNGNNGNGNNGNDNNGNDNNGNGNNGNDNNGNNPLQDLLGNNGLCGIDLSDIDLQDFLDQLSQLLGNQGNNNVAARIKASNKQSSSLPIAKFTGFVQFSAIQATKTQATRQTSAAKQDGGLTLTFKIVPEKVVSLNKGDFIQASFNGKVESGLSLGGGKADLFDPVTGLPTTVQLS